MRLTYLLPIILMALFGVMLQNAAGFRLGEDVSRAGETSHRYRHLVGTTVPTPAPATGGSTPAPTASSSDARQKTTIIGWAMKDRTTQLSVALGISIFLNVCLCIFLCCCGDGF
jgi:hypothetical protein